MLSEFGDLKDVNRAFPYLSTFDSLTSRAIHRWDQAIIDSCDNAENIRYLPYNVRDYLATKCNEFAGIVWSRKSIEKYRNRFCAYCHESLDTGFKLKLSLVPQRSFDLSVLISLGEDGTFQLRASGMNVGTWSSAVCPNLDSIFSPDISRVTALDVEENQMMLDSKETGDSMPTCQVKDCFDIFNLTSDGSCKGTLYARIAFNNDRHLDPFLCWSSLQRVAEFITCGLDLLLDLGPIRYADFINPSISASQDLRTGKMLHVVDLSFKSSGRISNNVFAHNEEEVFPNLHKLAVAIKTFQTHRLFQDTCPSDKNQNNTEITDTVTSRDFEQYIDSIDTSVSFKEEMIKLRGPIIDGNTTTLVCGSKFFTEPNLNVLNLRCFDDVVYEQDERDMLHLLRSPCINPHDDLLRSFQPTENFADTKHNLDFSVQGITLIISHGLCSVLLPIKGSILSKIYSGFDIN